MRNKIKTLDQLAQMSQTVRGDGYKVVLCHGTFDLLHPGHSLHFEEAKAQGDLLFVTLTGDAFVNRGDGRPWFNEEFRALAVAAQGCVDAVAITQEPTAFGSIEAVKPNVYAKGIDYSDMSDPVLRQEIALAQFYGGRAYFTASPKFSSTEIMASSLRAYIAVFDCIAPHIEVTQGDGDRVGLDEGLALFRGWLRELKVAAHKIVFVGNGGSAALAEHQMSHYIQRGIRCIAPTTPALFSQMANDFGYAESFSETLKAIMESGDILVAISGLGKSANIQIAIEAVKPKGCIVVTLTGFNALNRLRRAGDLNFYVPSHSYGIIESCHDLILHGIFELAI